MNSPQERRRAPRLWVRRSGKVLRADSHRFTPARTVNISAGGALLHIKAAGPVEIGERVTVGLCRDEGRVIRQDTMTPGRIVRVTDLGDGRHAVAVCYDEPAAVLAPIIEPRPIGPTSVAA